MAALDTRLAVTVTFVTVQVAPGDTVALLLGENRDDPVLRPNHRPMKARPTRLGAVPHLPGPDPER